jgi:hypothetical protein
LDYENLFSIPAYEQPLNLHTALTDLKSIAVDRIYKSGACDEASGTPSNFKLELFFAACHLSTTDDRFTTLHDLGCIASLVDPLKMFVVPRHEMPFESQSLPISERSTPSAQSS